MSERAFRASVDEACRIVPDDWPAWQAQLASLRGQRVIARLERERDARTLRANAYWWGVVVRFFQEVWSLGRTQAGLPPYNPDETHDVLVQVLVGYEDGPLPGSRVRKRTSLMDKTAFARLVDDARALALQQYGSVIPLPGERGDEEGAA